MIYTWRKQLFEGALNTFKQTKAQQQNVNQQIKKLEEKLQQRDRVISEIVSENIKLKKNLNGES
jgi:septal ring factor EnvC (AmiA/AmiB activator)